jgi:hypothetical protein
MRPTVGRTVHYRSFGTPGGEYPSACRAAIITEVGDPNGADADLNKVGLAVLNPEGMFFNWGVTQSETGKGRRDVALASEGMKHP